MSICIYPVRPEQLVRLGARTALQPLQPFLGPRYHRAPWDLNRTPQPPHQAATPLRFAPTPGAMGAGQLERLDPLIGSLYGTPRLPRVMSGYLGIIETGTPPTDRQSISAPIPFPFVISGLAWRFNVTIITASTFMALWLVDNRPPPSPTVITGTPIIGVPRDIYNVAGNQKQWQIQATAEEAHTWSLYGDIFQCEQAGKRLALVAFETVGAVLRLELLWTVRELILPQPTPSPSP